MSIHLYAPKAISLNHNQNHWFESLSARYNSNVNNQIEDKLKQLPKSPGVYFHKNAQGEIIYVGKAAVFKQPCKAIFSKVTGA